MRGFEQPTLAENVADDVDHDRPLPDRDDDDETIDVGSSMKMALPRVGDTITGDWRARSGNVERIVLTVGAVFSGVGKLRSGRWAQPVQFALCQFSGVRPTNWPSHHVTERRFSGSGVHDVTTERRIDDVLAVQGLGGRSMRETQQRWLIAGYHAGIGYLWADFPDSWADIKERVEQTCKGLQVNFQQPGIQDWSTAAAEAMLNGNAQKSWPLWQR